MLMRTMLKGAVMAACLMGGTQTAMADPAPWVEVIPSDAGLVDAQGRLLAADGAVVTDRAGQPLVPSCAFGPEVPEGAYKFFTQAGDPAKLLIVHDGGGACWEGNTCGTVLDPNLNPLQAVYDPIITERAEDLPLGRGVFDDGNTANPFRGWTKVYIPYCTGDIGWGNKVTTYTTVFGDLPIHHRGYANVRTAMRWVERHYANAAAPAKVMVTGISAGGYAAPASVLPEVRRIFPAISTRTAMVADSANGIVTDDFLQTARANWGFEQTLPNYLVHAINGGANGLPVRFYAALAAKFPSTRLGQFQNAYDLNESAFYNVMLNVNEPFKWFDPQYLLPTVANWSLQARLAVGITALLPNYRFYTAAGTEHTITLFIPPEAGLGVCSDDFYTENSARGRQYRNWIGDMANANTLAGATHWRNATCFPNCVAPPLPGCEF